MPPVTTTRHLTDHAHEHIRSLLLRGFLVEAAAAIADRTATSGPADPDLLVLTAEVAMARWDVSAALAAITRVRRPRADVRQEARRRSVRWSCLHAAGRRLGHPEAQAMTAAITALVGSSIDACWEVLALIRTVEFVGNEGAGPDLDAVKRRAIRRLKQSRRFRDAFWDDPRHAGLLSQSRFLVDHHLWDLVRALGPDHHSLDPILRNKERWFPADDADDHTPCIDLEDLRLRAWRIAKEQLGSDSLITATLAVVPMGLISLGAKPLEDVPDAKALRFAARTMEHQLLPGDDRIEQAWLQVAGVLSPAAAYRLREQRLTVIATRAGTRSLRAMLALQALVDGDQRPCRRPDLLLRLIDLLLDPTISDAYADLLLHQGDVAAFCPEQFLQEYLEQATRLLLTRGRASDAVRVLEQAVAVLRHRKVFHVATHQQEPVALARVLVLLAEAYLADGNHAARLTALRETWRLLQSGAPEGFDDSLAWGEIDLVGDLVRPFILGAAAALADAEMHMGLAAEEARVQTDPTRLLATIKQRADQLPLSPITEMTDP